MSTLHFTCPATQKPVSTGVWMPELDDSLDILGRRGKTVACPYCGESHEWSAYFAYFLEDDAPAPGEGNTPIIDAPLK